MVMVGFGLPVPGRVVRPGFIREGPGEAAMVGVWGGGNNSGMMCGTVRSGRCHDDARSWEPRPMLGVGLGYIGPSRSTDCLFFPPVYHSCFSFLYISGF